MKLPKKFKQLSEKERMKYAMNKKKYYENRADAWTTICRKLATNTDFTPLEMEIVDTILEKDPQ